MLSGAQLAKWFSAWMRVWVRIQHGEKKKIAGRLPRVMTLTLVWLGPLRVSEV